MSMFKRKPKQEQGNKDTISIQGIQSMCEHSIIVASHKHDRLEKAYYDAYQYRVAGANEAYGKALFNATMTMTGIDYDSFLAKAANVIPILESRLRREYEDSITAIGNEYALTVKEAEVERDARLALTTS